MAINKKQCCNSLRYNVSHFSYMAELTMQNIVIRQDMYYSTGTT